MPKKLDLRASDLLGFSRLANGLVEQVTGVVEELHNKIAFTSSDLSAPSTQTFATGITAMVYRSIRGVTGLVGSSLLASERLLAPANEKRLSSRREATVAAVNGVFGDYLVQTNNPLAISMSLRRRGRPLQIERNALQRTLRPTAKLLLLAHGLCLNDLQWKRKGHDHGAALARDLGYTPLYLHYNSGLHVSENGKLFSALLETLVEEWPLPLKEMVILGHSMGGLVARSAYYYGKEEGHRWPSHLRRLIFLGTPHHGAPLERLGNWADTTLESHPYAAPFARLGKIRSAGITDMRYGNLLEADWKGRDRFAPTIDLRKPVPLPGDVQSYAIAATRQPDVGSGPDMLGDGLVTLDSALGRHPNPEMSLGFADSRTWIACGMNHWDLLSHQAVYQHLCSWLASEP